MGCSSVIGVKCHSFPILWLVSYQNKLLLLYSSHNTRGKKWNLVFLHNAALYFHYFVMITKWKLGCTTMSIDRFMQALCTLPIIFSLPHSTAHIVKSITALPMEHYHNFHYTWHKSIALFEWLAMLQLEVSIFACTSAMLKKSISVMLYYKVPVQQIVL